MNSEEAKEHLLQIFFELDNSGPIYRGDSLDMLSRIGARTSHRFAALRHRLAKASMRGRLDPNEVYQSFAGLLGGTLPTPNTWTPRNE